MSQGLREVHRSDIAVEIEKLLVGQFKQRLGERGHGHCMRVADLDADLMRRLAVRLRADIPGPLVHVLSADAGADTDDVYITSTKLVELRNPDTNGELRPPLLVFVPNELRTSSEDSFGIATFEDVRISNVYEELNRRLLEEMPVSLRSAVQGVLQRLKDADWKWASPPAISRFLLTLKLNDFDSDVVGAALYELGLVPDFKLLSDPTKAMYRAGHNAECVGRLTAPEKSERLRVIDLGLEKRAFRADLANFLAEAGLENPYKWTRQVVVDRANWRFTFDKWEFEDEGVVPDQVYVEVVSTSLPRVGADNDDERLDGLIGQQILPLGSSGLHKFSVAFRVDPLPSKVEGLTKFRLQVISVDGGPTGVVKGVSAWKSNASQKTVTFTKLSGIDWEEGWHFIRIQALTEDGEMITLLDRDGSPLPWLDESSSDQTQAPNESDLFYVVPEGDVSVEPIQRAIQRYPSLLHAQRDLQFSAVLDDRDATQITSREVVWSERSRGSHEMIEATFGSEGSIHIPVSPCLKSLEQRILAHPDDLCTWRIAINRGVVGDPIAEPVSKWDGIATEDFLAARKTLFEAIRHGEENMVSQGTDYYALRDLVIEYSIEYQSVLQTLLRKIESASGDEKHEARMAIEGLLNVDVVYITLTNYRGQRQQAALIGPLHPLRCLWLAGWAALGDSWIEQAGQSRREFVTAARDVLLSRLAPTNQPPYLSVGHGRVFTAVDNVHPLWTLYAPNLERDSRGLIGNICSAFSLPEPDIGGLTITGKYLAGRVQRYLIQHPYIRTLTINAFNPGRAKAIADTLLELQGINAFEHLHYDIRLFVPDAEAPGVGEGLLELLNPQGNVTALRADAFSALGCDHLNPKLRVAIRPTSDFRSTSDRYPAHISVLFDVFPAEEVSAGRYRPEESGAPVHGLLQDFVVEYTDDGETVAWTRQPRHGHATPLNGAETISDLLSSLPAVFSAATAAVATGQAGVSNRPQVTLALDNDDRALIHQVHEVSDWVFTVDRNIGIEYFDHNSRGTRPDYLIEHTPSIENGLGHQLVITSRSLIEIEAMMHSVLERFALPSDSRRAAAVLESLRCLSGRLGLKLISSPSQRAEALGLALSKMYLAHQGVFSNQIVVPLDDHLEFYTELRKQADELQSEVSLKRTDLALFDLDAGARTITCNLVEVKCYSTTGSLSAYTQLKDNIAEQLEQSEKVIRTHFDPDFHTPDRIDRAFKTAELAKLLEFYLDRSVRFGVLDPIAAQEARFFVRTLEDGYDLKFTRSGLIFDFEKAGVDASEIDNGVEFHRIGIDVIRALLDEVAAPPAQTTDDTGEGGARSPSGDTTPPSPPPSPVGNTSTSVPVLDNALFFAHERDRSVSWETLTSRSLADDRSKPDVESPSPRPVKVTRPHPEAATKPHSARMSSEAIGSSIPKDIDTDLGVRDAARPNLVTSAKGEAASLPLPSDAPKYDVILGSNGVSPQYGMLGEFAGRKIALDLNQTHTISLFGVQGGGKSYTLGTIVEMATVPLKNINSLPSPLATVIFHYSPTQDYRPEFTSMAQANSDESAIGMLRNRFDASPQALKDVVLLVPKDKLELRRTEYPGLDVYPLCFSSAELQVSHWQFLMGAVGNQAVYIRQLKTIMRSLRNDMSLSNMRDGIDQSSMPARLKDLARMRLDMAAHYIDDSATLRGILHPGRLVIVDLRDEFIEKDEALGLFVVLLQLFGDAEYQGQRFNKLIVFDEAHKYIESPDLVAGLVQVVREMRHKGTSILVASQDPLSVPVSLIELSTQIVLHRFNSPAWLKHIQKANAALNELTPEKMAHLQQGEAYAWSSKASDGAFSRGTVKIVCRPRVTQHGGSTKTAVK